MLGALAIDAFKLPVRDIAQEPRDRFFCPGSILRIDLRAAVAQAAVGAGRVVLFGFRVQHRGQSLATFRLLFNAIFTAR